MKFEAEELREIIRNLIEMIPNNTKNIRVNIELCSGCERCYEFCPAGCFEIVNGKSVWQFPDFCLECGTCNYICPEDAISWSYPKGGEGIIYRYG